MLGSWSANQCNQNRSIGTPRSTPKKKALRGFSSWTAHWRTPLFGFEGDVTLGALAVRTTQASEPVDVAVARSPKPTLRLVTGSRFADIVVDSVRADGSANFDLSSAA